MARPARGASRYPSIPVSVAFRMHSKLAAFAALLLLTVALASAAELDGFRARHITGGQAVEVADVPFLVLVVEKYGNSRRCLGVLLTERHVITAAHCVDGLDGLTVVHISGETISSGSVYASLEGRDRRWLYDPWVVALHPEYDPLSGESTAKDLALIDMHKSLESRYVRPIRLATEAEFASVQPGAMLTSFGVDLQSPSRVSRVDWPIVACPEPQDWLVCVRMSPGRVIERGDSGGPMLMQVGDELVLVGTAFYSDGVAAVVAGQSADFYRDWIADFFAPPFVGLTATFQNSTGGSCEVRNWSDSQEPSRISSGASAEIQIAGESPRAVVLVECGQP